MEAKKIVQNCLANYPNFEGAVALKLLLEKPDTPMEAINLAYATKQRKRSISLGTSYLYHTPIPMTDEKTLHAVNKRLNALIAMQAEMLKQESFAPSPAITDSPSSIGAKDSCKESYNANTRMSPSAPENCSISNVESGLNVSCSSCSTSAIDAEINALIRYRHQCVRPGGAIRNFSAEKNRAYDMVRNSINRVLKKAEADGHHEAVALIKASLKQGKMFKWGE